MVKLTQNIGVLIQKNFRRLGEQFYTPEEIFNESKNPGWPGDWQGRILLALYSHYMLSGKKPEYLDQYLSELESHLNIYSYFGEPIKVDSINEQQLAGNSWYLRFLCLWYQDTKDEHVLNLLRNLVNNLFIPIYDYLDSYPIVFNKQSDGSFGGTLRSSNKNFLFSTDTGCIYIALDGLAHAYSILKDENLLKLINKMSNNYFNTDVVKYEFQTHATLTALRGVIELYENNQDKELLMKIEDRFDDYIKYGMTLNYSNYNWFNRKNTWTEPCAIIDSFIIAKKLYIITKKVDYLDLAYRILYNSILFAGRENGGFGCDKCCTGDSPQLKAITESYEAYWCCTMRGGEFCREVSDLVNKNDIIMALPGIYDFNGNHIEISGEYPYKNTLIIKGYTKDEVTLNLPTSNFTIIDSNAKKNGNKIVLNKNDSIYMSITFDIKIVERIVDNVDVLDYGIIRLIKDESQNISEYEYTYDGIKYTNIPRAFLYNKENVLNFNIYVKRGGHDEKK